MNFPTVDDAENYLRASIQSFYDQSRVLRDRLLAIGKLMQEAQKQNNQDALGQLILLQTQTKDTFNKQLQLEDQLKPFAQFFGVSTTLGLLPIILAVSAIGVATAMYLHFETIQNQAKALDLVAKGLLPADQANAILNPSLFSFGGGGAFSFVMVLLVGGGLLYLASSFKRG